MNDFTKLNESIAKLGSALEAFWSGETPKRPPSDQPAIDACVKQLDAIVASVPVPGTKLPIAKPGVSASIEKGYAPQGGVAFAPAGTNAADKPAT